MSENINYRGFEIKIESDSDPMNPRTEFDNLGTMVCLYRRYELGDKGHKYNDSEDMWIDLSGLDTYSNWYQNATSEDIHNAAVNKFEKDHVWLPLYLYDHSGITMKTSPFSCRWDSGQVGIIYISRKKIAEEYGWKKLTAKRLEKIVSYLKGEVACYDDYLTGNVYGYNVEDSEENNIGSCWGFFGYDHEKSGLLEMAKNEIDCHIASERKTHFEQLKAWIRSKVLPQYRQPAPEFILC